MIGARDLVQLASLLANAAVYQRDIGKSVIDFVIACHQRLKVSNSTNLGSHALHSQARMSDDAIHGSSSSDFRPLCMGDTKINSDRYLKAQ